MTIRRPPRESTDSLRDRKWKEQLAADVNAAGGGTGLSDGDKGDIIVGGSGTVFTIDSGVVSYSKMQNVSATDKVLGRSSAGAGQIEEIACTPFARSILDDTAASDVRSTLGLGTLATQSGTFSGTSSGTNTGDQTITLTGDVTGSGTGSFAATIANQAVTYAKFQNISATDKLLGRVTAGAGVVEEITCTSAGRALLDDVDAAAQRTTLGLGTLATQSGTFSGTSSGTNTGDQNLFSTISVAGQSDVVADATSDTLTLAAGSNVTLTTDAATDTVTISASTGATDLDGLSDVAVTSPVKGQFIVHNGTSFVNSNTIESSGVAVKPLIVKAAASQTANLVECVGSAGTALLSITSSGTLGVPNGSGPGATSIYFLNNTNMGIYRAQSNVMGLSANGQATMAIDGTSGVGRVNIANTSGTVSRLQISDNGVTSTSGITLGTTASTYVQIYRSADNALTATGALNITNAAAATKALVVKGAASQTASLLDVQNSAAASVLSVDASATIGVQGTTAITTNTRFSADAVGSEIILQKSRGASIGTNTIVSSGDVVGKITFKGANGTGYTDLAAIQAAVDTTPGASNDMPGRITFSTTADASGTLTERMRMDSGGAVMVGTSSTINVTTGTQDGLVMEGAGTFVVSRTGATLMYLRRRTSDGTVVDFRRDTTQVGTISVTTTATAYNTSSDYRLKENVEPIVNALDDIVALNPCTYTWKANGSIGRGFIAHEIAEVLPEVVTGEKDAVDENGDPSYQQVDYSKLTPLLAAALKELHAEVQALKAELAQLKEANG